MQKSRPTQQGERGEKFVRHRHTDKADDVALRKESVDRNHLSQKLIPFVTESLSARRAWIEMIDNITQGVFNLSLSARRAWIEMNGEVLASVSSSGSLSARRAWIEINCLKR